MSMYLRILSLLLVSCIPMSVSAATVSVRATPAEIGVGDLVRISFLLDSAFPANAFSGTVRHSGALHPVAISDGSSMINLWIVRPALSASAPISFAGITPGGFSGNAGTLFSVIFRAKRAGEARVSLADLEVLRNDGTGEREPVTISPLILDVAAEALGGYKEVEDTVPPESFTAELGNDASLFEGRSYVTFTAADKESGIERYAVAESRVPALLRGLAPLVWNESATSPYMLVDQDLTSTVYIRAVDRSGNERVSVFPPQRLLTVSEWALLAILLTALAFLWRSQRRRRIALHS